MQIKEILLPGLKTISADASMAEAEKLLKEHNIRHLPVSKGSELVGILSDRDIQRAMTVIKSHEAPDIGLIQGYKKVSDYMTSPVLKMKDTDTVENLLRDMLGRKISCFIIENSAGQDIGIITTEDLLVLLLDKLTSTGSPLVLLKSLFSSRRSTRT